MIKKIELDPDPHDTDTLEKSKLKGARGKGVLDLRGGERRNKSNCQQVNILIFSPRKMIMAAAGSPILTTTTGTEESKKKSLNSQKRLVVVTSPSSPHVFLLAAAHSSYF